ncbi:baseplate [Escherichia phage 4E8]|nr:baseplate [Escherichia phage 4E8]
MAIETTAVVTTDLNPLYPRDRDYLYEGAAQIRLVKQVLINTFPNITEPVQLDSDSFNILANKVSFTGDSMDVGGLTIKNLTPGTGDKDAVTKGQMEAFMLNWMQNKLYRIGAYYITEEDINPGDSSSLGFGSWAKVTGVVMGTGVVNPDGSVPNAQRVEFQAGGTGGRVFNTIRADNMPLTTINGSSFQVSSYSHSHNITMGRGDASGHNSSPNWYSPGGGYTQVTDTNTHSHSITGSVSFGRDDVSRQPINTLPPFRAAHIWRRIS